MLQWCSICQLHPQCPPTCLQEGSREGAMQAYRQLQALDKSSVASAQMLAQLARASADTDPAGARQMQARLPPHQQPSELDVDALEAAWAGRLSLMP